MDIKVVFVCVLVFYMQMDGFVSAISLKRLSEKMDSIEFILEKRLELEISQRHTDYDNILSKLDIITTKIEKMEEKSSISSINTEQKFDADEDGDLYKADKIKILITGIKAEKKLNAFMRSEMSRMGRALNDLNTRVTREVSREDVKMTETNYKLEELFNNLNSSIENGFSMILSSQKDTRRILRQELEMSTSQLEVAEEERHDNLSIIIKNGISKILTIGNESRAVLHTEIEQCLKKHVDDGTNITTETSNTHSSLKIPASSEKIHSNFDSCKDALTKGQQTSGVYTVHDIKVYCDQTTEGGGWTVFQRRMDGSEDFYRDWASYKQGFGNVFGEFWLGNDYLSEMLTRGNYELRIDMQDFEGNHAYAKYNSFRIDPESNNYTLHIGKYSGTAGDSLVYHNGRSFSTKDMDLDTWSDSCAKTVKGAWWYKICHFSNLNGLYHVPPGNDSGENVVWYHLKNTYNYSLKFVEMKFRQTDDA